MMKVANHLPHSGHSARHAADQIVLVAVIDAHVRIGRPDQHRVDSAVALFQIIEIAIDGVLARDRIVEVAVLNHHLRLNEAGSESTRTRACRIATHRSQSGYAAHPANAGYPRATLSYSPAGHNSIREPKDRFITTLEQAGAGIC